MKKLTLLFLAVLPLLFTACSDDDDNLDRTIILSEDYTIEFDVSVEAGDSIKVQIPREGGGNYYSIDFGDGNIIEKGTLVKGDNDDVLMPLYPDYYVFENLYEKDGVYRVKIKSKDSSIGYIKVFDSELKSFSIIRIGKSLAFDNLSFNNTKALETVNLNGSEGIIESLVIDDVFALKKINLSSSTNLKDLTVLNAANLKLIENINECVSLTSIRLNDLPQLSFLDLSENRELSYVHFYSVGLDSIKFGQHDYLGVVSIQSTNLSNLDIKGLKKLASLFVTNSKIESIDLANNEWLESVCLNSNSLSKIDVTKNEYLWTLEASSNDLTEVHLRNGGRLNSLILDDNKLEATALNDIFMNLKNDISDGISFKNNPGAETADFSIATNKGWNLDSTYKWKIK